MEALGIDLKLLLAQTINFVLFFIIFKKFLYAPFLKFLDMERKNELEKQRLLKDLQEKETGLEKREQEVLADARAQALQIMKTAEETADKKKKEILKNAHDEIVDMKLKAKKDIEDERTKLHDEVKSHVIQVSRTLTTSVLKDFIDEKNQHSILERIFKEMKKGKIYEN